MKTFKLISLHLVKEDELVEVPLEDGLIINREDDSHAWLIEAFTDKGFSDLFHAAVDEKSDLLVQVVITHKDNPPAPFKVKARSVQAFEKNISVLLEGTLIRTRNNFSEELLSDLVQKGLSGEELVTEFKAQMKQKSALKQN